MLDNETVWALAQEHARALAAMAAFESEGSGRDVYLATRDSLDGAEAALRVAVDKVWKTWILDEAGDDFPGQYGQVWDTFNSLPEGSLVATGFVDTGLVYFRKVAADRLAWRVVRVDIPDVADILEVGYVETSDPAVLDAGGDIERAYVVRVGA